MRYGGNVIDVRCGIQSRNIAIFTDHTVHCGRVKGIFFCANVQIPEREVREPILHRFRLYVEIFAALAAAVLLSLEYAGAADLLGCGVGQTEQDQCNDGFHDTNGDRERDLTTADTEVVDVKVKHFDVFLIQSVAESEELVNTGVQEVADAHNEQNEESGHQQRNGDVADTLPAVCTVDHGRFVHFLIQTGDGSEVDDCVPAEVFPCVKQCLDQPDVLVSGEDVHGHFCAELLHQRIDQTGGTKQAGHQREHDDPADEVRQRGEGLHTFLEAGALDLAEEDGEQHGDRHQQIIDKLDAEGVAQNAEQVLAHDRVAEQVGEILEAYKLAVCQRHAGLVLEECVDPTPQGHIMEYEYECETREDEQEQLETFDTLLARTGRFQQLACSGFAGRH